MKFSLNLFILAFALTGATAAPRRLVSRGSDNDALEARTSRPEVHENQLPEVHEKPDLSELPPYSFLPTDHVEAENKHYAEFVEASKEGKAHLADSEAAEANQNHELASESADKAAKAFRKGSAAARHVALSRETLTASARLLKTFPRTSTQIADKATDARTVETEYLAKAEKAEQKSRVNMAIHQAIHYTDKAKDESGKRNFPLAAAFADVAKAYHEEAKTHAPKDSELALHHGKQALVAEHDRNHFKALHHAGQTDAADEDDNIPLAISHATKALRKLRKAAGVAHTMGDAKRAAERTEEAQYMNKYLTTLKDHP